MRPGAVHNGTSAPHPVQATDGPQSAFPIKALPPSGPGQPLPTEIQSKMELSFGTDFSEVRVHVGPQAPSIGALAYTHGTDIYFAPGQYQPSSHYGQQLFGHELTHVMQQRAGRVRNPFGPGVAVVQDPALEAEADRMGVQVMQAHLGWGLLAGGVTAAALYGLDYATGGWATAGGLLVGAATHYLTGDARPNPHLTREARPNLLPVLCQPQQKTNWCWAAVAQAVIQYYEHRVVSQEELADSFTEGGRAHDEEADPWLALGTHRSGSDVHSMISWDAVTDEINRGFPIVGYVGPKNNAHYILIVGYTGRSYRDPNRRYIILDPERGGTRLPLSSHQLMNYHDMYRGSVYTKP